MATQSYWQTTERLPDYPPLKDDLTVDVAVVGGGNTGVTAAYLMKRAGLTVALLERDRCGGGDTGSTSAHLTYVTDLRVSQLVRAVGRDHAAAVWEAGDAAVGEIEATVRRESIAGEFVRVPGFLSAALDTGSDERETLQAEAALAAELGFPAAYTDRSPVFDRPGIRFPDQARIHPHKYLRGVLDRIPGGGSFVFERTEAKEITSEPVTVSANGKMVRAGRAVLATDVPLQGASSLLRASLLQTKITPYTSYVVGAEVRKGTVPDVLVWDTSDPYYFLRLAPGPSVDYVIFGGADHKTGQEDDTRGRFARLESALRGILPGAVVRQRWSGQVIEAVDGLPYIGETAPGQFIATGFSGNGLTFGTVAAMMACDWVTGRRSPWSDLFAPTRKKLSATWNYLKENIDYPYYLLKDRLARAEEGLLADVRPGVGRILQLDGRKVAAYRDAAGQLTTLSPVCTHLGCLVRWNATESTWDCPCHGSRFRPTGEVLAGPAEEGLHPIQQPR